MLAAVQGSGRYQDLDSYSTGSPDKLPVVELRPFTTKQWLPSKSRPQASVAPTRAQTSLGISSSSVARGMTPRSSGNAAAAASCPRAFSVTGERVSKHPPLRDSKNDAWKADGPVTAFVSKLERQKSTLDDIKSGQNINSKYSCMKRSLTEVNITQQQDIRVKGKRMDKLPPRLTNMYCEPWELYASNAAATKHMMLETLCVRIESLENAYLDENIYDPFDRARTLPSIHVKPAHMAAKVVSQEQQQQQRVSEKEGTPYRLGVNNTLDLMSHVGRPLGVEHQMTSDLKLNLQHYRRTKETAQMPHGLKGLPSRIDSGQPTPGEASIKTKFNSNTAKGSTHRLKHSESLSVGTASQRPAAAFTSLLKYPASDSGKSMLSASWSQAESIPANSVVRSLTHAEFQQAHAVTGQSEPQSPQSADSPAEIITMDTDNNNRLELELESIPENPAPPTSASQEILTIPTDEDSMKPQNDDGQDKSTVFITDKEVNSARGNKAEGNPNDHIEDRATPVKNEPVTRQ